MREHQLNEATFLRDVATHEMKVVRDDGLYRHLRFKRPKSMNMYFDITTWPGYLCYSGDMGCYVFTRITDMFEFFRDSNLTKGLSINPSYWGQKVEAVDRCCGLKEYSADLFREGIESWLNEVEASLELRTAVKDRVLTYADEGEHEAMRAAMEFEHDGFTFQDFYEVNVKEYSFRFLWCCYAVAWAVRMYDGRSCLLASEAAEVRS